MSRRHRNRGPRVAFLGRGLVRIKSEFSVDGPRINRVQCVVEGAALQRRALHEAIRRARWLTMLHKQDVVESQIEKGD